MFWFISALVATLARTGTYTLNKKILKDIGPLVLTTTTTLFVCIIYSPIFFASFMQNPVISLSVTGYYAAVASGFLNAFAALLLMKALKIGDMSIAVPLRSLVPLFAMFWAILFLGEAVTLLIAASTLMIIVGALLLHMKPGLKLNLKERGSLFALSTAVIYSFTITADKIATTYIEPAKYTFLIYLLMLVFLVIFTSMERKLGSIGGFMKESWRYVLLIAVLASVGSFFTFTAISLVPLSVIAPVLRLEVLFSVIAGGLFFREQNIKIRLLGAFLLFLGVVLIVAG